VINPCHRGAWTSRLRGLLRSLARPTSLDQKPMGRCHFNPSKHIPWVEPTQLFDRIYQRENTMRTAKLRLTLPFLGLLAFLMAGSVAGAGTRTWVGTVSNIWSESGNWSGGVPGPGDQLVFLSQSANRHSTNDLARTVFGSLSFPAGGNYQIEGNPVALSGGISAPAGGVTIVADLDLTASQTLAGESSSNPLVLAGTIEGGAHLVTLRGVQVAVTGRINGWGGVAANDVVLDGVNANTGPTEAEQLAVNGTIEASPLTARGGPLRGVGTIGSVTCDAITLGPGQSLSVDQPGVLSTGDLFVNGGSLQLDLNGPLPGQSYDRVTVLGTVALNNQPALAVTLRFMPARGQVFVVVDNDGGDAISGTFAGMPEGTTIEVNSLPFVISYVGNTGNDVTLTCLSGDPNNQAPHAADDTYEAVLTTTPPSPAPAPRPAGDGLTGSHADQRLGETSLQIPAPGVLGNDSDPDHDTLAVAMFSPSSDLGGAVAAEADGSFTYTPPPGYCGPDAFSYVATDGQGGTGQTNVTILVLPCPQTLTVLKGDVGTVTSLPVGINCGSTCSANFDYNAVVTLAAADDPNAQFLGWSGEGCSGTGPCTITTNLAKAVTASFCHIQTWFADTDGDGYGSLAVTTRSCTQPTGFVADNSDCDDSRATIHPGAPEICDALDNDCDGRVDEPDFEGLGDAAPLSDGRCGIELSWGPATPVCKSGPPVYTVYRSADPDFTPDPGNRLATCITDMSFVDSTAPAGEAYTYIVRAEDTTGDGDGACYKGHADGNLVRIASEAECTATVANVPVLTARAGSASVTLEWVNPSAPYGTTLICARNDEQPSGPGDGVCVNVAGAAGGKGTVTHSPSNFGGIVNGTTYHYAAFVNLQANGQGQWSSGRFCTARPFATTGAAKWAYSTGATAMAPAAIRAGVGSYSASNNRLIHAMKAGVGGGTWPTSWRPYAGMNGPALGRLTSLGLTTTTIGGTKNVVFAGSQDGRVYALNADTGAELWKSEVLASVVQTTPSVMFTDFGGIASLVFVGTRNPGGDNAVVALKALDGTVAWRFDNGGGGSGMGIINSQIIVEYATSRLYVLSHAKTGGSDHTSWCLQFTATTVGKVWSWARGDADTTMSIRNGALYFGNNAGSVMAVSTSNGALKWSYATGAGPVKGLWRDTASARLFATTTNHVHALNDLGARYSLFWATAVNVPSASFPVLVGTKLYVGSDSSRLYQVDVPSATPTWLELGDPAEPKTIGHPAYDSTTKQIVVGSDQGAVFSVTAPF